MSVYPFMDTESYACNVALKYRYLRTRYLGVINFHAVLGSSHGFESEQIPNCTLFCELYNCMKY